MEPPLNVTFNTNINHDTPLIIIALWITIIISYTVYTIIASHHKTTPPPPPLSPAVSPSLSLSEHSLAIKPELITQQELEPQTTPKPPVVERESICKPEQTPPPQLPQEKTLPQPPRLSPVKHHIHPKKHYLLRNGALYANGNPATSKLQQQITDQLTSFNIPLCPPATGIRIFNSKRIRFLTPDIIHATQKIIIEIDPAYTHHDTVKQDLLRSEDYLLAGFIPIRVRIGLPVLTQYDMSITEHDATSNQGLNYNTFLQLLQLIETCNNTLSIE